MVPGGVKEEQGRNKGSACTLATESTCFERESQASTRNPSARRIEGPVRLALARHAPTRLQYALEIRRRPPSEPVGSPLCGGENKRVSGLHALVSWRTWPAGGAARSM